MFSAGLPASAQLYTVQLPSEGGGGSRDGRDSGRLGGGDGERVVGGEIFVRLEIVREWWEGEIVRYSWEGRL